MNNFLKKIEFYFLNSFSEVANIWIFKNSVLVLDFEINGKKIAFDLKPDFSSKEILVEMFSRDNSKILQFLESEQGVKKSGGKYIIYKGFLDDSEVYVSIIKECILKMQAVKKDDLFEVNLLKDDSLLEHGTNFYENNLLKGSNKENSKKYSFNIIDVVERDVCIGCGACNVATDGKIRIFRNEIGIYQADKNDIENISSKDFQLANEVCPFTSISLNENELDVPNPIYRDLPYNEKLGRYSAVFAARKVNENELLQSSSGGMTSWLVNALFSSNKIDAVLHVGKSLSGELFEYKISYSIEEAEQNKKSAYYSITLAEVIDGLKKNSHLRYAIVGLPCFIKSVRLLAETDDFIKKSILYYLGLVCGHLKSSFFAEANAWQLGVPPEDIEQVDFRVKNESNLASKYDFLAKSKSDSKSFAKRSSSLVGGSWGYGFFQPNACNYCDDIFAETADVVFADAWLPEFTKDWSGTNVVISRNKELNQIFQNGLDHKEIKLSNIGVDEAIKSQAGGFRHRRDGLKVRLFNDLKDGQKIPLKRVEPSLENVPEWRIELIKQRQKISRLSLEYFKEAKKSKNLNIFLEKIKGEVELYKHIDNSKYPKVEKKKHYDVALFGWHYARNLGGALTVFALHQVLTENGMSVVVVPKPGNHKITSGNRPNYEILDKYYTYAKERPFERLHELRNYCDNFVLASDQLWAGKWISFKPEFEFLACGDKSVKKISVATSFGGDGERLPFDNDKKEIVSYNLKRIDHISVREPSGVDILKSVGVEGTQILDPVFLCSDKVYSLLKSQSKVSLDNEYVMGYILDFQESLINFAAKDVGDELNIKTNIFTTTMEHSKEKNTELEKKWNDLKGVDFYSYPSIADFVNLIANASFVVTDSFHGACMSVIFNKPFICAPRSTRGSSRFALFEQLGLKSRIVSRDGFDVRLVKEEINWEDVNKKLEKMRGESFLWMSKAFNRYMQRTNNF
ncbi:MAG: Coenzyme F420 hydrogenase/dehydrogenase, beta subunit C-terminal domain [Comamonas sp.]|jgi:coenzyme F420-reducing hydrogenase beta subunit|uniref:Coenzyme F420 hydrogenase/dehydrogenase, beta subunit C-terminal domain n=1 Tax=Comamonas sp. TaxID=34028 RepID=UPI002820DC37|nr:Coenzyme F420 hydrogenase/dehydrogenase, beta subunit C-terminal domain [Comamonas sp.]MDR0215261.1 Coenzyme F420 hydrogenase/dehydrogenase, beta subunit C-terminal domain [Comamonas sp.]